MPIETTLYGSLAAQWTTLVLNFFSLFQTLQPKDKILQSVLWIETIVQAIQLSFYKWYLFNFDTVSKMTFYRYHDWFLTTPLMLFSTMIYYDYNNTDPETETTIQSFVETHWKDVLIVFGFNLVMLLFGYLFELNVLDLFTSQVVGFGGLIGTFYVMWKSFASKSHKNFVVYALMAGIWALYGVAALLDPVLKNASYNVLDIVSKNFYGIFLSVLIYSKSVKNTSS